MREFFVLQESRFFAMRMDRLGASCRKKAVAELARHLRDALLENPVLAARKSDHRELFEAVTTVLEEDMLAEFSVVGDDDAEVWVPFHLAASLVARRRVEVAGGRARIDREAVMSFLAGAFRFLLTEGIRTMAEATVEDQASAARCVRHEKLTDSLFRGWTS